jgi:plasmid maintenance system antidote protein VapI
VDTQQRAAVDSAAELRAEIARQMLPIYRLAPTVGLHPTHLGQVLRGRRSLSPALAVRIRAALTGSPQNNPSSNAKP